MEKSKLGLSVCLFSAVAFLAGYAGLLTVAVVAGYILLKEENKALRSNAACAVFLSVVFTLLSLAVGGFSNLVSFFNFGSWMNDVEFMIGFRNVISKISSLINLIQLVVFGLFALMALLGKNMKIAFIDKMVAKHF